MPQATQPYNSKSAYLMGLQCQKLLWFRYNAKDQIPAPDEATQAVFDQGKEVGELAHQVFPGGHDGRPGLINPPEVVAETQKASRQFLRVTYSQVTDAERRRVRRDLEEYCGLDTLGMVQIVDQLARLIN